MALCCWLWRRRGHKPRSAGVSTGGKRMGTEGPLERPEGARPCCTRTATWGDPCQTSGVFEATQLW